MKLRLPAFGLLSLLAACGGGGSASSTIPSTLGGASLATQAPAPPAAAGNASPLPAVESAQGWSPYDLAHALQFPVQSGYDGRGQTVAIVMDQYPSTSDLDAYQSALGIPQTGRSIRFAPSPNGAPNPSAGATEATLDAETVAGLAPGANVIVYGLPAMTQQNFTDTVNFIVSNKTASVISFSAGSCEYAGATADSVLKAAAAAGIAVVASAGDQGNDCYNGSGFAVGVSFPASDPSVIGVGGTETLRGTGTLASNTVWNDNCGAGQQCIGGGGISALFQTPAYQAGLAGASQSHRNVPDVSMPAENTSLYENGWGVINGTSWSAPQYAALMAEVYEYCGGPIANPAAIPYYVFSKQPAAFVDVLHGGDQYGGTSPSYSAAPGFDDASGIGVPLGMPFAATACPGRTPAAGLIARTASVQSDAAVSTVQAIPVDVTPRVSGLADEGHRAAERITRVQLALRDSANAAAGEAAVTASLRNAGFTIAATFANHLLVDADAPSGTVERYFSTELHDVVQGTYGVRYLPVRQVIVPASISQYVSAVNLDDVVTITPSYSRAVKRPSSLLPYN